MMAGDREARLEIGDDSRFQRRQLLVVRITVAVFAVVIVLGLLGVFGSGPLTYATAGGSERLSVEYQRFLRFREDTELEIRLDGGDDTIEVALDQSYLDGFDLMSVIPEPDQQTTDRGRLVFTFERAPSTVMVPLTPRTIGLRRARVFVEGHRPVSFRQVVYP
jgi:hypothetical protein